MGTRTIFKKTIYREKIQHKLVCSQLESRSAIYLKIEKILFVMPIVLTKLIYGYIGITADDLLYVMENLLSAPWYSNDDNRLTLLQNEELNDYYVTLLSFHPKIFWCGGGDVYPTYRHSKKKREWLDEVAHSITKSADQRLYISCFWAYEEENILFQKNPLYFKNEKNGFIIQAVYNHKKSVLILNPLNIFCQYA